MWNHKYIIYYPPTPQATIKNSAGTNLAWNQVKSASLRKHYPFLNMCIVWRMLILKPGGCEFKSRIYSLIVVGGWVHFGFPAGGMGFLIFLWRNHPFSTSRAGSPGKKALTPDSRFGHMTHCRLIRILHSPLFTTSNSFRNERLSLASQWDAVLGFVGGYW